MSYGNSIDFYKLYKVIIIYKIVTSVKGLTNGER